MHAKGKIKINDVFGGVKTDPRKTVFFDDNTGFVTIGGNDVDNAVELEKRWNSHDDLKALNGDLVELLRALYENKYEADKLLCMLEAQSTKALLSRVKEVENG